MRNPAWLERVHQPCRVTTNWIDCDNRLRGDQTTAGRIRTRWHKWLNKLWNQSKQSLHENFGIGQVGLTCIDRQQVGRRKGRQFGVMLGDRILQ